MVAMHAVLALLLSSGLCRAESFNSFKNFPVVGLHEESEDADVAVEEQVLEDSRAPRQAEISGYQDPGLDDSFIEEALYLTPEDREEREFSSRFEEWAEEEADSDSMAVVRPERDGLGGHHGAHHGSHDEMRNSRQNRRGGRRQPEARQEFRQEPSPRQEFRQPQEPRGNRQSGDIGPAFGHSQPPNAAGDYNFNFSNDDGSSRQETAGPEGVKGSYSFITPEGEEVRIQYVADEFGFHATGSHVPKAPPMPPAIRRMLDHLAKVNGHAKLY